MHSCPCQRSGLPGAAIMSCGVIERIDIGQCRRGCETAWPSLTAQGGPGTVECDRQSNGRSSLCLKGLKRFPVPDETSTGMAKRPRSKCANQRCLRLTPVNSPSVGRRYFHSCFSSEGRRFRVPVTYDSKLRERNVVSSVDPYSNHFYPRGRRQRGAGDQRCAESVCYAVRHDWSHRSCTHIHRADRRQQIADPTPTRGQG